MLWCIWGTCLLLIIGYGTQMVEVIEDFNILLVWDFHLRRCRVLRLVRETVGLSGTCHITDPAGVVDEKDEDRAIQLHGRKSTRWLKTVSLWKNDRATERTEAAILLMFLQKRAC